MRQLLLTMALVGVAGLAVAADDKKTDGKKPAKIVKKGDASRPFTVGSPVIAALSSGLPLLFGCLK